MIPRSNGVGVWEHFTVEDGLPDMKIECILEDNQGVVWIGTHDRGVVSYAGDEFTAYTARHGLADSVFSVTEDTKGSLWFGTNRGLIEYDGQQFTHIEQSQEFPVLWGSCVDAVGHLWFGAERRPGHPAAVCRWAGSSYRVIEIQADPRASGRSIHKMAIDPAGNLWLGGDGLFVQVGDCDFEVVDLADDYGLNQVLDIYPEDDGRVLVTRLSGLWRYDGSHAELLFDDGYRPVSITKRPGDPAYWLVTYDGQLLRWADGEIHVMASLESVHRGGLCVAASGRMWVGTYGMGLHCYDDRRLRIYDERHGLPSDTVNCVVSDRDDRQWIGTKRGLCVLEDGVISRAAGADSLDDTEISGLLLDSGDDVWIGTRTGWLDVMHRDELVGNHLV